MPAALQALPSKKAAKCSAKQTGAAERVRLLKAQSIFGS
ncbi:hypothetical protein PH505_bi00020 [Pseudoalteromonas distincta]|nr:hypothetical protein PH505_bi00020 [Pseudoalteromonas distincta]